MMQYELWLTSGFRSFGVLFSQTAGEWHWRFISGGCMIVSEILHMKRLYQGDKHTHLTHPYFILFIMSAVQWEKCSSF